MTNNHELKTRHDRVMFPSTANYYEAPISLSHGRGTHVTDFDGREYLDFFGGILTVSVGHANPRVNARVKAQVERLSHTSTLYPNLPMVELAEKLVELTPPRLEKVYFCASGTEADETAVALAQSHTGVTELIALRHGYSGRSMLAQSLTAHSNYRTVPTQVAGIKHAAAPYCYRCPFGQKPTACALECAKDVEDVIETTTVGRVAGILVEPVMGVGGFITPPKDYFARVLEIVRRYGGIFIADEVQTGFGRTGGAWWGIEHFGVEPDVMTMAKGIANGFPISAIVTTAEIANSVRKKGTISTFGGNPISASAALGVIEEIESNQLLHNVRDRGNELSAGLRDIQKSFGTIGDVRGLGLMQGVELVVDEPSGDRTPNPGAVLKLFEETKKRGLLIGRGGLRGNVLRIAPPLTVTKSEITDALSIFEQSFAALLRAH